MSRWAVLVASIVVLALMLTLVPACRGGAPGALAYTAPYEMGVDVGKTLPGTNILYVGLTDRGAHFRVDGQDAYKQKGDSLSWKGNPIANAQLQFSGRVVWYTEATAHIVGTATITVPDDQPQVVPNIPDAPLRYRAIVTYSVGKDKKIPGTLVVYKGKAEQGAQLEGLEGYPYRTSGDSIVWQGKLRDGVYLVLNVRTVFYTDSSLQLAGTAEVMLVQ